MVLFIHDLYKVVVTCSIHQMLSLNIDTEICKVVAMLSFAYLPPNTEVLLFYYHDILALVFSFTSLIGAFFVKQVWKYFTSRDTE